jgi:hypothetical protein
MRSLERYSQTDSIRFYTIFHIVLRKTEYGIKIRKANLKSKGRYSIGIILYINHF